VSAGPADIERYRRLLAACRALTTEREPAAVLQLVVDTARELLDADYAALGVADPDGRFAGFIHSGMDDEHVAAIGRYPVGKGLLGLVIDERHPVRLEDLSHHPQSCGFPPGHPPMTTFLGVPVIIRGEVLGNLYLTDKRGGPFGPEDEEVALTLAAQAAVAIDNARAYEQARRASQNKSDFVSMVSHELRTPVSAVQGAAGLLLSRRDELPADTVADLLAVIDRQADRMSSLIADLLDLSRVESGRLQVHLGEVDLVAAAERVAESTRALHPACAVAVDLGPGTVVWADAMRVEQILGNLVVNAAKYGAAHVTITAAEDRDEIVVAVTDDGPGVPQEIRDRLFDRFVRGAAHDGHVTGSGLGLAIVAELARRFGGRAWYEPVGGHGSRFLVALPRREARG
jgi:signal transduction histidine kinase